MAPEWVGGAFYERKTRRTLENDPTPISTRCTVRNRHSELQLDYQRPSQLPNDSYMGLIQTVAGRRGLCQATYS